MTDILDPVESERSPSPLVRVAGKYGAIAGLILTAGLIIIYFTGRHPFLISILFDLRILMFILFIFVAIREFKDDFNNKTLHFWQGLYLGIIVYVTAALIASLLIWIFAGGINPNFVQSFINLSIENLEKNKDIIIESLGENNYNAAIESLPSTTASNLAFDYFLKSMPIGLILTLIISIIMRNKT